MNTDGHIPNGWIRTNVWKSALDKAGLGFHVTPHGLRHAHASWLLAGGADLQVVKERLGHGSITTTEKYLHALPYAHDDALAALQVIRPRQESPPTPTSSPDIALDKRDAELARLRPTIEQFKTIVDALQT